MAEGIITDELKTKLAPVNNRLREIERERLERAKVRKRVKVAQKDKEGDVQMTDPSTAAAASTEPEGQPVPALAPGDLPDEKEARAKEAEELKGLADPSLTEDIGANSTGMYELCGA